MGLDTWGICMCLELCGGGEHAPLLICFAVKGSGRGASDGSPMALGSTGAHEVSGEAGEPTLRCNPTNEITNAHKHNQVPLEGKR